MGRTKRRRSRNRELHRSRNLGCEDGIISLSKWMKLLSWKNETYLRLRQFETTGRGVFSIKSFASNDVLIEVPYELLITFSTLQKSDFLDTLILNETSKLKFQDLLILFLIVEKFKGLHSAWHPYINSLPHEPTWLPLRLPQKRLKMLSTYIRQKIDCCRWNFEECWTRLRKSINCCSGYGRCVSDVNSFTWAYTMVNTRAVYVNPRIIHELSGFPDKDLRRFLSDEPCMALCPFLDMFNHGCDAGTVAELKMGSRGWFYELRTLCGYKKYEQVFISYGSHDNITLLCEYGFFIPWNQLDTARFDLKQVLNILGKQISSRHNKLLLERRLDQDLCIGFAGISFNLKAVLYSLLQNDLKIWTTCVFSDTYPMEALVDLTIFAEELVRHEIRCTKESLLEMQSNEDCDGDEGAIVLTDFLKYRVELLLHFCELLKIK